MTFICIYFIIFSCFNIGKKYLPKIHQFMKFLASLPRKSPWITLGAVISCFLVIHEDQYRFSKAFGPLLLAGEEIESIPTEFMQQFRPHADDEMLFELLKKLITFSLFL